MCTGWKWSGSFDRTWIFLAHETEFPQPGDFVSRNMGQCPRRRRSRQRRHSACVAEQLPASRRQGLSRRFRQRASLRLSVSRLDLRAVRSADDDHLRQSTFRRTSIFPNTALARVPRLEVHKGLIFGSWNADVVSLVEYLGDIAWYIDPFLSRSPQGHGGAGAAASLARQGQLEDRCAEFRRRQSAYSDHPCRAADARSGARGARRLCHRGREQLPGRDRPGARLHADLSGARACRQTPTRHIHAISSRSIARLLKADQLQLLHRLRVIVGTIFPNLSFIETQVGPAQKAIIFRQWQPVSGTEMEILSWVLAETGGVAGLQGHGPAKWLPQFRRGRCVRAGRSRALGVGDLREQQRDRRSSFPTASIRRCRTSTSRKRITSGRAARSSLRTPRSRNSSSCGNGIAA